MLVIVWLSSVSRSAANDTDATPPAKNAVHLSSLDLTLLDQQWNVAKRDASVSGKPLSIGGRKFSRGIGTHATSQLILHLNGGSRHFHAWAGVDDSTGSDASVRFSIHGDGKELWKSNVLKKGDAAVEVSVDVSTVKYLSLRVDDGGNGISEDHADWAEPTLTGVTKPPNIVSRLPQEEGFLLPGRQWTDTDGKLIQAHGGGIIVHEGRYYWYGEDRSQGYVAIGVSAYVSSDLVSWKHLGVVLPRKAYDAAHGESTICERPKVNYNPTTGKFVMWFHYDRSGYGDSQAGVAVADRPEGPFGYLGQHRPIAKSTFRDMGVFVDDDKGAYVFYAGEDNQTMHVVRLNADWTAAEAPMVEGRTWARIHVRRARESPATFKFKGKYYLLTSGTTGWHPNPADLSVADHVLGPYRSLGNPCVGPDAQTTFRSQNTYILPEPGKPEGHYIYMGDRWKPNALADSRYVWLPFRMQEDHTTIEWNPIWKPGEK
jgi:hypothetical protein